MSRKGQVWEGPIDHDSVDVHLILDPSSEDREVEQHITLNLSTGMMSRLLMIRIDEDRNWRRLA